jgi:tetrahydromethanopterin S-methyltransferase subunit G
MSEEPEKSIEDLEKEKLRIEIEKLNYPWFKKLELWKIIIPTIAILLSLYFTFGRGIVDAQKERLATQKENLKLEILQFKIEKGEVQQDISVFEKELIIKELELKNLNRQIDSINRQVKLTKSELSKSKKELSLLAKERGRDRQFYLDKLKEQYRIEKNKIKKENRLLGKISELEKNNLRLSTEVTFLRKRTTLSSVDSIDLSIKKSTVIVDYFSAENEKSHKRLKQLEEEFDRKQKEIDTSDINTVIRELDLYFSTYKYRDSI